jgi:hypothetical protein
MSLDASRQVQRQSSLRRSAIESRRQTQPVRQAVYGGKGTSKPGETSVHFRIVDATTYPDTLFAIPLESVEGLEVETISYQVENLAAGSGFSGRPIHTFALKSWIVEARIVNGATVAAGFGTSGTSLIRLSLPLGTVASKTYGASEPFPGANAADSLGRVEKFEAIAGNTLQLSVSNSVGVDLGAFQVEVDYLTTPLDVLKPYTLRRSEDALAVLTQNGGGIVYAVDSFAVAAETMQSRRATTSDLVVERQVVVPRYRFGHIIRAVPLDADHWVDHGLGVSVVWEDLNIDGRQWAKRFFS